MALPTRKNWRSVRAGLAIGLALAICPLSAQSSINLPSAVGAQTSPSSSNPFNDWHAGYGVSLGFRIAYSGPMKLAYSFIGRDGLTSSALTVNLTTLSAGTFDFNAVMGAQDPAPGSPPMDRSLVLSMTQTPANFLSSAVAAPMMAADPLSRSAPLHQSEVQVDQDGLRFGMNSSIEGDYVDMTVDVNIQVQAVPEPHEWAFMMAGLGAIAAASRRRRRP